MMLYFNSFAANTGAVTIDLDGIGTRRMLGSSGQGSGADLAANNHGRRPAPCRIRRGFRYSSTLSLDTKARRRSATLATPNTMLRYCNPMIHSRRLTLRPAAAHGDLLVRTNTGKEWQTSDLDDLRVIATYADLPAPSAATEGIFYYIESTKDIFITEPVTEFGVPQLGSFDTVTTATRLLHLQHSPASQLLDFRADGIR